ncbi:cytochrome P450 [Artemisia annua]|uniref:Cytochrome P450 n=1 Tax=Artemisia annua TaxID=35608 RepID=A0A2U1M2L6_ARTAN|nr:cytochrome P450 [Artemisia annua]
MHGTSIELPLPPGPYAWPIIGNILQTRKNVYVHLAELAQVHGPLMSLRSGQRTLIIGSSSAVASEILKTHDDVLSGREVSRFQGKEPSVINMNLVFSSECDDGWRVIRNLYRSELFSGKALESSAKMRENKVEEMVKYLGSKEGEDVIIKDVLFVTAMNILSNTVFSTDLVDFEGNGIGACIMDTVKQLNILAAKPKLSDIYPKLGRWDLQGWYKEVMHIIQDEFGSVWKDILEMKRNGSNISSNLKDFADSLIEKGTTNLQINLIMQELFSAGTETTSLSIEWFIAELMKNQEVMHKAKDEVMKQIEGSVVKESDLVRLPFLEACFKETLRLHPPGPLRQLKDF